MSTSIQQELQLWGILCKVTVTLIIRGTVILLTTVATQGGTMVIMETVTQGTTAGTADKVKNP